MVVLQAMAFIAPETDNGPTSNPSLTDVPARSLLHFSERKLVDRINDKTSRKRFSEN